MTISQHAKMPPRDPVREPLDRDDLAVPFHAEEHAGRRRLVATRSNVGCRPKRKRRTRAARLAPALCDVRQRIRQDRDLGRLHNSMC